MAKLIIALLSVQAVVPVVLGLEFQGLEFNTVDEVVAFANDIGTKSSVEEQAVLKTLLNERGQWHPEATSLFKDVVKRPSSRRLASVGSRKTCNGATEAACKLQVDDQCSPCQWAFGSCNKNQCAMYKSQADCCANAMKIATGCAFNKDSSMCMPKTCTDAPMFTGASQDDAVKNTNCNAQPGCTSVCVAENAASTSTNLFSKAGVCLPGSDGDYTCTGTDVMGNPDHKRVKNMPSDMSMADAMGGLMTAMGASDCNLMECASCLKSDNCAAMKTSVAAGGKCNAKCSALAQSDAEVECLFCGQKAAGCTPLQATPFASCGTVALTDIVTTAKTLKCDAACAAAKTSCPSTDGAEMNCFQKQPPSSGAAGLTAAMVGLFAPVFACLLVEN